MQEYVVGFRIFDGRSLQSEDGAPCDPFVVVQCAGNTYETEILENRATSSLVPWNEGCIWPVIQLSPAEFDSEFIEFRVYARYWWTRNYLIGKATLQLSFVNKRKRHLYARRWLCLRPENQPNCTGMLNVTVYALRPGDQAPSATEQMQIMDEPGEADGEGDDAEDLSRAVLKATVEAPPGNPHHMHITISRVEDLVDLGGFGGPPSPYVTVEFGGCMVPTSTARRVRQFTFNEEIVIPVVTPIYEDTVIIKLWSSNLLSSDELLAQGLISFSELRNHALAPRWFNLYGWNTDEIPDVSAMVAAGSDPDPNYFKGRVLISGRVERLEEGQELQKAGAGPSRPVIDPSMIMLALLADVYMVTGADGRKCRVEVKFGSHAKSTESVAYDSQTLSASLGAEGGPLAAQDPDEEEQDTETQEEVRTFSFGEREGRAEPLLILSPEDPESQPYVMVNVFTEGYLIGHRRIAYAKCRLSEFPAYEQGNPSKPRFIALEAMPDRKSSRTPPSVLIAIEKHTSDDVVRHPRRKVKPMAYIVRAYCFLGRQVSYAGMRRDCEPEAYGLRIACAGVSKATEMLQGPRPMWMQPLDLRVVLCSDSPKEPPTIEPIVVTLVQGGALVGSDLGKAVCVYTHMRQRDQLHQWEPFSLDPQWIKVFGGPYGRDAVGEVLIAFELLMWRFRDELRLQPREMWPQPEDRFDRAEHFCRLRRATLHFSMQGLRNLAPLANMESLGFLGGSAHVQRPMVTVRASRFFREEGLGQDEELVFHYAKVKPSGDERVQADRLQTWLSKTADGSEASNFEFLQVGTMRVLIPDSRLLQPYAVIRAWEKPSEGGLVGALGYQPALIGESLQSLNPVLPCCWIDGVSLERSYAEQKDLIAQRVQEERAAARAREYFQQWTGEELRQRLAQLKEAAVRVSLKVQILAARGLGELAAFRKAEPYCTCEIAGRQASRIRTAPVGDASLAVWNYEGRIADYSPDDALLLQLLPRGEQDPAAALAWATLPAAQVYPGGFEGEVRLALAKGQGEACLQLKVSVLADGQKQRSLVLLEKEKDDFLNGEALPEPLRTRREHKRRLQLFPVDQMNVRQAEPFTPRRGLEAKAIPGENARGVVQGKLENSRERPFVHDFWYKNSALLRNQDIVDEDDERVDWNFQPGLCFGFVKCTFKLTDGWGDPAGGGAAEEQEEEPQEEEDDAPPEASDAVKLRRSYEFDSHLDTYAFNQARLHHHFKHPSRVPSRVRVRIYFVKAVCIFGKGQSFADPYLSFQLGRSQFVSMKNMWKAATNTPDFYHFEERDVQLPYDGQLQINISDLEEMAVVSSDPLIGSTIIDLEDRWHSRRWRRHNEQQAVPNESRALFTTECPGKNRGALEMWVELVETTKASDMKPSDIRKPADLEVEVRLVIWGASGVPAVKDDYSNVKISTMLDCKEYGGEYYKEQETDVHFACRDGRAVFAFRMVYPCIQMPVFSCAVQFSLYHSELVAGDTFIGSLNLDLKRYVEMVSKDMMARELGPTDLKFQPADAAEADDDFAAAVNVSLYVMTQMEANGRKQGIGRNEPNDHPQLITPTEGREWGDYLSTFGFGWPDFGLWKKMIPVVVGALFFLASTIALKQLGLV